jgi:hypothetical protein
VPLPGVGKSKAKERRLAGGHVSYCSTGMREGGRGSVRGRGEAGCSFVRRGVVSKRRKRGALESWRTVLDARSRAQLPPQASGSVGPAHLSSGKLLVGASQARHLSRQSATPIRPKWTSSSLQSPRPFPRGRPLVTRSATAWTSTTPSGHCITAQSEYGPSVCMRPGSAS